ncbi:DUF1761 domain-containing protein [Flavobacterium sp.]|jgi:hypothetical protein|uniref:DUF1761 domain-containing protein n=1 Tax=Flavobacterium sp. TaxID=239 RepID=UPI0037BF5E2B
MELINFKAIFVASFSSLIVGFIWYNPKVFGTIWMNETGMTEEKARQSSMLKVFGLTLVLSFMLAFIMPTFVIHQFGALGMIGGPSEVEKAMPSYLAFLSDYGNVFRTYKHGALHGSMIGLFVALPVIATNCLFEQKSFKYAAITSGYWIIVMTIMGAIICGWK